MTDPNSDPIDPADIPADVVADLEARLQAAEAQAESYKDQLLRALADAENTRRRMERQAQDSRQFAIERFARDLLAVVDNFERASASLDEAARAAFAGSAEAFVTGVELTGRELESALARHGLQRTPGEGPFDPNLHQAVAQIPSAAPAGHVAQVFQSGFTLNGRVLRAAMVAVSLGGGAAHTPPASETAPQDGAAPSPGSILSTTA